MATYDLSNVIIEELHAKIKAILGDKLNGLSYPPLTMDTTESLTVSELLQVQAVLLRFDLYGSYDPEMLKDLTLSQLDTWIDTNVTDLSSAKTALKRVSHAVLFLLQRDLL